MNIEKIIATVFEVSLITNKPNDFINEVKNIPEVLKCKSIILGDFKAVLVITIDPKVSHRQKVLDSIYNLGTSKYMLH